MLNAESGEGNLRFPISDFRFRIGAGDHLRIANCDLQLGVGGMRGVGGGHNGLFMRTLRAVWALSVLRAGTKVHFYVRLGKG